MAAAVFLATIPTGPFVNFWLALPMWVFLLLWMWLLTWADKDAPNARLPRELMNSVNWGGLVLAMLLFLLLPLGFAITFPIFLAILLIEIGIYLWVRQRQVGLADLKEQFHAYMAGMKKEKVIAAVAGEVQIIDKSNSPQVPPSGESPDRPGYDAAQLLLTEPLRRRAERVELIPSSEGAMVTYAVDGVRYEGRSMDRASAAAAVTALKSAAALDIAEKRKPQQSAFKAFLDGSKRDMQIITKGSSVGESLVLNIDPKKRHGFAPAALGFSPEQLKTVTEIIADNSGLVLLAAPVGQGLTGLEYGMLRGHDAFLQHIITVEHHQEQDLEGVTQNQLGPNASGAEEAKQVAWVISQEPDVTLLDVAMDANSARELAKYAGQEQRRVYLGFRAGTTFEALRQFRKLMADDSLALRNLKLIIAGRTIRKLCSARKIAYVPDPTLLKLSMDPAKVTRLYQARTTPLRDAKGNVVPCTFCSDLGFKGRTGVYEVFVIDDAVRQVIKSSASDNELKSAFRKQKGRYLQEMALALVEQGETSVNEVQRVLRAGEAPAAKPSGAAPV